MTKKLVFLTLVILLVAHGCSAPIAAALTVDAPTPQAVAALLVKAAPNATVTPTPFQPIGPTPIPSVTLLPTFTASPTPTATPELQITDTPLPTPIPLSETMSPGTVNILVLGNDSRPHEGGFRTDVIMFVSIDKAKGRLSIISFPRDLYVTIPGWNTNRINTAYAYGGFPLLAETFQTNFGIRPQYYVMTNFQGFTGIIDSLGGITVDVGAYFSDACDLSQAVNGRCTLKPGKVVMDGPTALWYVRSRHTTSDFDRTRRAQEVLYGLFGRFMHIDAITRLPEFYSSYKSSVQTNMTLEEMLPLMPIASKIAGDPNRIHRYSVTPAMVSDYLTEAGAMVLLPNYYAINAMINEAINGQ